MKRLKSKRKSFRQKLTPQQKLKRRELRLRRKQRKLKVSLKTQKSNEIKMNTSKYIRIGKKVLGKNYTSVLKNRLEGSSLVEKYDHRLDEIDTYPTNGESWNENMKDLIVSTTKRFIDNLYVMTQEDSVKQLIQTYEEGLIDMDSEVETNVEVHPSQLLNLSKKKRGLILDGLLKHHQNLIDVIGELDKMKIEGGVKEFRTQKIDINKTNIWSCYDDFTYGLLEWFWEERELILQCITKPVFGGLVRRIYTTLGHPCNRIEIEKGCIENLLIMIQNDEEMLSHFRGRDNGSMVNKEGEINDKQKSLIHSWFKENPFLKKIYGGKRGITLRSGLVQILSKQKHLYTSVPNNQPSGSIVEDLIQSGELVTPELDISHITNLKEDELMTIYRSVSDKEHPLGWSWTTDKETGLNWIRGRGLVDDLKKKSSYLVETQIPKKDILFLLNNYEEKDGGYTYNEVIVTKEKLKNCELKITEVNGDYDSVYDLMVNDKEIKKCLIHDEVMRWIQIFKDNLKMIPKEQLKDINEKWYIRKMWLRMSLMETETSLGKKYNELTGQWENFEESLSSVQTLG